MLLDLVMQAYAYADFQCVHAYKFQLQFAITKLIFQLIYMEISACLGAEHVTAYLVASV